MGVEGFRLTEARYVNGIPPALRGPPPFSKGGLKLSLDILLASQYYKASNKEVKHWRTRAGLSTTGSDVKRLGNSASLFRVKS